MPWPDPFGRRRLEGELRRLADETAALRRRLDQDRLSSNEVAQLIRERQVPTAPPEVTAGRFVRLSWFYLFCLTWALIASTFALPVFNEPSPTYANLGQIQVALATSDRNGYPYARDFGVQIESYYSWGIPDTTYVVVFPRDYVGKRFVILLSGSAVLESYGGDLVMQKGQCSATRESTIEYQDEQQFNCQAFYGTVPKVTPPAVNAECNNPNASISRSSRVAPFGFTRNESQLDLVHSQTTLPDYRPYESPGGAGLRALDHNYSNMEIDGLYAPVRQSGCKIIGVDPDQKVVAQSQSQSRVTPDGRLVWTGDDANRPTVLVTSTRNASGLGNGLLAFIGALAGLGIGFIPVAYDAWREWRQGRRHRPSRWRQWWNGSAADRFGDDADLPGPDETGG